MTIEDDDLVKGEPPLYKDLDIFMLIVGFGLVFIFLWFFINLRGGQ